jgi:hypothetical protein
LQNKNPNEMQDQSSHEFKLIDGQFHPNEAKNMLMSLFNSKIEYHQLESFSNHIRLGSDSSFSQKRIHALTQSIESINDIIQEAIETGKQLKIEGLIQITFME